MRLILSKFEDPFINLALETCLFRALEPPQKLLFIYFNDPCIVIGRNQNPFKECRVSPNIPLLRRFSGGGTVVHDQGVANLSLQTPRTEFDRTFLLNCLIDSFPKLKMTMSSRFDVFYDKRKVCGSASRIERDKAYHHATFLLHGDLKQIRTWLYPKPRQGKIIDSLGTDSVRASITNTAIGRQTFLEAFTEHLKLKVPELELQTTSPQWITPEVEAEVKTLKSWEHTFGKTPKFKMELEGSVIEVDKGMIVDGPEVLVGKRMPLFANNPEVLHELKDFPLCYTTRSETELELERARAEAKAQKKNENKKKKKKKNKNKNKI